jgi:hypothetical protein
VNDGQDLRPVCKHGKPYGLHPHPLDDCKEFAPPDEREMTVTVDLEGEPTLVGWEPKP